MASTLWNSERLFFRGIDPEDDDLLADLSADADAYLNASTLIPTPRNKKTTAGFREWLTSDGVFMCAIICLPGKKQDETETRPEPIPIGFISLSREDVRFHHHKHCEIGIQILHSYRSKGYGSEAIQWALRWGFKRANMHRIGIGSFSFNTGAIALYERLGFTHESRRREYIFHDGGWYDLIELGMLQTEWKEKYDSRK